MSYIQVEHGVNVGDWGGRGLTFITILPWLAKLAFLEHRKQPATRMISLENRLQTVVKTAEQQQVSKMKNEKEIVSFLKIGHICKMYVIVK